MSDTLERPVADRPVRLARPGSVVLGVAAAALASLAVDAAIAQAVTATHPSGVQTGLSALHFGPLTVLGVLLGTAGWAVIRRSSSRPRQVLRTVVPLVVLVSFVPDLLLLSREVSAVNVAGLLCMHVAIAAITVPVLARVLPLPPGQTPRG